MSAYRTPSIVPYQPRPFPPELISTGAGSGTGAGTLAKIIVSSSTANISVVESSGAATLSAITASGTGLLNGANGSATLSGIIVSSSTTNISVAESSGAPSLSGIEVTTGTGGIAVAESSGAATLGSIYVSSGVGLAGKIGSGAATLSKATVSSSTANISVVESSGAATVKAIIADGTGITSAGAGAASLGKVIVSSSTADIVVASSSGAGTLKEIIVSTGIGITSAGQGAANFHNIYVSRAGVGHIKVAESSGAGTLKKLIITTGVGHTSAGQGAATLSRATVSSSTTKITVKESSGSASLHKITVTTGTGDIVRPTLQRIIVTTGTGHITVAESSGSAELKRLIITTGIGITSAGFGAATLAKIVVSSSTTDIRVVESSGAGTLNKIIVTAGTGKAVGPTLANIIVTAGTGGISVPETSNSLTLHSIVVTTGKGRVGPTLANIIVSIGTGKSGVAGTGATLVQSATDGSSGSTSLSLSYTSNITAGNYLIAAVAIEGGLASLASPTVSDNLDQDWEKIAFNASGTNTYVGLWRVLGKNNIGGSCTLTVDLAHSLRISIILLEYSGMGSIGDFVSETAGNGNSNMPGTLENVNIGDLVVGFLGFSNYVNPTESVASPFTNVRSYLNGSASNPAAFTYSNVLQAVGGTCRLLWTFSEFVTFGLIYARFTPYYAGKLGGAATLKRIIVSTGTGNVHHIIKGTGYPRLSSITVSDGSGTIINRSTSAAARLKRIIVSSGIGIDGYGFGRGTLGAITVSSSTADIAVIGTSAGKLPRITASGTLFTGGYGSPELGKIYVSSAGVGGIKKTGSGAASVKAIKVTTGTGNVSVISTTASPRLKRLIVSIGIGQAGNVGNAVLNKITVSSSTADVAVNSTSASGNLKRIACVGFGKDKGIGFATLKPIKVSSGIGTIRSHHGSGAATLKRIGAFGNGYPSGKGIGYAVLNSIVVSTGIGYKRTYYYQNIHDSFTFGETPFGVINKVVSPIVESLSFTEELLYSRRINNQINELLDLSDFTTIADNVFYRTIDDQLTIVGGCVLPSNLGNIAISLPELFLSFVPRKKNFVSLSSQLTNTSILLPAPELGDTEAPQQKVVSKRSMNNVLITYVRKNNLRKLNYTFVIGRPMALNLRTFLDTNIANVLDMQNWKGEVWKVQVTNNPVEFTAKSLFANEGERYEIELELKGIRLI